MIGSRLGVRRKGRVGVYELLDMFHWCEQSMVVYEDGVVMLPVSHFVLIN